MDEINKNDGKEKQKNNKSYWIEAIIISLLIILFTAIFLLHVHLEKEAESHVLYTLNKTNTIEDLQQTVDQYEDNVNNMLDNW